MKNILTIFSIAGLLFVSMASHATIVTQQNSQNQVIKADWLKGTNTGPAILILHGFLQTHDFPTITRLASALNDLGYDVLTPTLSLGLGNRKKSIDCEAIHTHSMQSDTEEVSQWINWLTKKTAKKIILIGHSAGSTTLLNYIDTHNDGRIKHSILISLSYYASGPAANETPKDAEKARKMLAENPKKLGVFSLNYCMQYPSYPADFLSYYNWTRENVSKTVGRHHDNVTIIIGTSDKRLDKDWRKKLTQLYNNVISIDKANHFFDQTYEFELHENIEELLKKYSN